MAREELILQNLATSTSTSTRYAALTKTELAHSLTGCGIWSMADKILSGVTWSSKSL